MVMVIKASLLPRHLFIMRMLDVLTSVILIIVAMIFTVSNIVTISLASLYLVIPILLHIYGILTALFCLYKLHTIFSFFVFLESLAYFAVIVGSVVVFTFSDRKVPAIKEYHVMFNVFYVPGFLYEQLMLIFLSFLILYILTVLNLFFSAWFCYGMRKYFRQFEKLLPSIEPNSRYDMIAKEPDDDLRAFL